MTTFRAVAILAMAGLCDAAFAAEPAKTQVLLVGTYHFSNPGRDLHKVKAVDVLAADRQRDVQLVDPLS